MVEKPRQNYIDEVSWICTAKSCIKRRSRISIRNALFFSGFRLSLADVWTVFLMWCEDEQVCSVVKKYGINKKTVISCYKKLRNLANDLLYIDPVRLGGPGIICQIDESLFCHKQKYGKGRQSQSQIWVFGISGTSYKQAKFYLEIA